MRVRHGACIRSVLSATSLRISVKSTPLRRRDSVVRLSCRYAPQIELGRGVPEMARLDLADPDLHVQRVGWVVGPPGLCGGRFRPQFHLLIGITLLDHLLADTIGGNRPVERAGLAAVLAQQTA